MRRSQATPTPELSLLDITPEVEILAAGGIALGGAAALQRPPSACGRSNLPPTVTPTAYAVPRPANSALLTPDCYTYADNLVIERHRPGKPHQGKVLAAIQAHSDDITLFCAGTVAKLIAEGYTGYLIRPNDEKAGKTVGYGPCRTRSTTGRRPRRPVARRPSPFYCRSSRRAEGRSAVDAPGR